MKVVLREWLHEKHALFLMIISLILSISVAIISAKIITDISSLFNNPQNFNSMILVIVLLLILQIVFISMNEYLRKKSIILAYNHMASRYYDKILNAEYEMFTKFSVSKIYTVSNAMKDITAIAEQSTLAITYIVNIIVVLTTIWTISHSLIIPILIIYIIGTIIMRLIFNKYRKYDEAVKNSTIKRNQELENIINGFAEVRVFNNKDWHRVRIKEYLNDTYISRIARNKLNIVLHGSIETIESLGIIFVIIYAIYQLRNGSIDAATAMSLVLFIMKLINPILGLLSFIDSLSEYLALIDDYDHIINFKNQNNRGNLELGNFNDEITLNNISFSYDNTTNAVNNLSMTIKKGQRIGICGYSGGGKSTLFKLINKFYVPSSGIILIDGINLNSITDDSYRRYIGSVLQDTNIFPGTIKENILYGNHNAMDCEVIEAAKQANLYEFINSLPDKFNTDVGPKGLKLSGGQRQRIALARLFLKNPEIILLDEATSALDNESETFIQNAIDNLEGKTIITIAHRLSTIKNCDVIYVMDQHGIVEYGSHDELIASKGVYYKMLK